MLNILIPADNNNCNIVCSFQTNHTNQSISKSILYRGVKLYFRILHVYLSNTILLHNVYTNNVESQPPYLVSIL